VGSGPAVVRDAAADDLATLRDVFRRSALVYEVGRDALLAHPEHLEFSFPADGEWRCRVAVAGDGTVLGFATVLFGGGRAELEDLFVDPEHMRLGVGSLLVADLEDVVRHRDLDRIEVTANPNALAFYERVGFVGADTVQTALGPGIRMHRTLP
jgi:GNAT superfamily N-acetyltransferase